MKHKTVSFSVILTLVLSVMIPTIFISQYIYININNSNRESAYDHISRVRDEKVKQIKNFYEQEFHNFEKIIDNIPKDSSTKQYLKDIRYLLDFQPNIKQVVMYDYNFKPIINLGRDSSVAVDDIPETIRVTIQKNFYFSKYFLKDLQMDDGTSSLVFFYKEISGDRYYSITMDYSYLSSYLVEFGDLKTDIYNDKYQIVASSRGEYDSRRVHNNPLTEKLILGLTENIFFKDYYNSFTHIDIGGEKLFINTYINKEIIDLKSRNIRLTLIFFYIVFTVAAILVGNLLTRFFYHVKESTIREEIFSDRFSFFYRINKSIKYIDDKFIEVQRLSKALNFFKNDITTILDELPQEESSEKKQTK